MHSFSSPILFLLLLGLARLSAQVTIQSDRAVYTARRGDTVTVMLSFSQPVAHGLESYYIRLNHAENLVQTTTIQVVPELDFDVFDPPALRDITPTGASVRGFTEIGEPLYADTDFVIFQLTLSETAPFGDYPLSLSIPLPNSFINGLTQPIDATLVLGGATLTVVPFFDDNTNNVPDDWELQFYPTLEDVPASVEIQGQTLTLRETYVAGIDPTGDVLPVFSGFVTLDTVEGRLYDIYHSTDLTDEEGWEIHTTLTGDGTPQTIPDPEPGFYRFEVRLP